jgi:CubicO group peptidase (beta-lactamase class C family)/D-alanyl-D-alanine dipeptidase
MNCPGPVIVPVFFLLLTIPGRSPGQAFVPAAKPYTAVADALDGLIMRELADKGIPAASIALVDDQTVVWAKGFGLANSRTRTPATADTVYRVGSVSKLFTDLAVMQLVERGVLDLDAPVTSYLPDFKPANPFGKAITLRQLMAHRSGLVREPPVGHYFDPAGSTLAASVASLNRTELVYAPETHIKYSNAGVAAVGYVLERTQKEPFAPYLKKAVLDPLGLRSSGFEATPELNARLCTGMMWTYHGRTFDAPTFPLGIAPAGCMYSTVNDLGRFMSFLFAGGRGRQGPLLKQETLEAMWKPQFAQPGEKSGFGLGFHLDELQGHRRVGHNGAIYGFATTLSALPDEKLGVAVVVARDCANALADRIADNALEQMLAARRGQPLPAIEQPSPVPAEQARKLAGRYQGDGLALELIDRDGKLFALSRRGGFRMELRRLGDDLITDDRLDYGHKLHLQGSRLMIGPRTLRKMPDAKPQPPPERWSGLIGEYGWDHDTLYILEREGKLYALIEWFFFYPLEELSADVFRFPAWGLYDGEKLVFRPGSDGRATAVEAAGVLFQRRRISGDDGTTFHIPPQRPLDQLRREALADRPPDERGSFVRPDLVELIKLDPTIKLDIRYATTNNFLTTPFYASARAFLQRPAAEALVRAHRKLAGQGYGLLIHDGYRPWYVTKMFWEATPEKGRIFVANPAQGSRHNRGCAVDLTLYDLKTGKPVPMTGGYDEMSDRSYPDYPGGTSLQRWHRELLRGAMEAEGFSVYEAEWWHFDYKDWRKYPILNLRFEEL